MSKDKKEKKKKKAQAILELYQAGIIKTEKVKSKCCKKYKKGEEKRCGKCPCFDLLENVA